VFVGTFSNWNFVEQLSVVLILFFFCGQEELKYLKLVGEWYRERHKNAYEWVDKFTFRRTTFDEEL